jgi:hypothetical protein
MLNIKTKLMASCMLAQDISVFDYDGTVPLTKKEIKKHIEPDGSFWWWEDDNLYRAKYGTPHRGKGIDIKKLIDAALK